MVAKRWNFSDMDMLDVLKTMGLLTLQLMLMFFVKALVYIGLVKLYKFAKARYFPDKTIIEETDEDKHLFDYESDWVDSEEKVETKISEQDNPAIPSKEEEMEGDMENYNSYNFPDQKITSKVDEFFSELRGRKIYKPMTEADFEKMKLEIPIKWSSCKTNNGPESQEPHFKQL